MTERAGAAESPDGWVIDADYPGGNIVVDAIAGETVQVRQDRRDTEAWWFYWNFRVRGAAGRTLTFEFTDGDPVGTRGPAVSTDGGQTWNWGGWQREAGFGWTFGPADDDVRFAFCLPYLEADLARWLARHAGNPHLRVETLCTTRAGRTVEQLRVGRVEGGAPRRVLLTSRHHCCETMGTAVLEGLLEAVLADTADGAWLRAEVEFLAIPLIDKDGVEAGDQGKYRRPRDHNRDYSGESLHESTGALRELVPVWAADGLEMAIDFHCPWIRGTWNEHPYFVGPEVPRQAAELALFSQLLAEAGPAALGFHAEHNLAAGQAWNNAQSYTQGWTCARWARNELSPRLAMTLEFPYANVRDQTLSLDDARGFGGALATTLRRYLPTEPVAETESGG